MLKEIFPRALNKARMESRANRTECAVKGMKTLLMEFETANANTKSSGVRSVARLASALRAVWTPGAAVSGAADAAVEALLLECEKEIVATHKAQSSFDQVFALYWRAGWAYSADYFRETARAEVIKNKNNGSAVTPGPLIDTRDWHGNPYVFISGNSGYLFRANGPSDKLYRGDQRDPYTIANSGGFLGRDIEDPDKDKYSPWYDANSSGGTVSFTAIDQVATSIQAGGKFAKLQHGGVAEKPREWLIKLVDKLAEFAEGRDKKVDSYVYEVVPNVESFRNSANPYGKEECFLGVPNSCITRWWAVLGSYSNVGPFRFPADGEGRGADISLSRGPLVGV